MNPPPLLPGVSGPAVQVRVECPALRGSRQDSSHPAPLFIYFISSSFNHPPPATPPPQPPSPHIFPLSPLSLCLPQFSAFDRLTPKPCFIPAPQAAADTSFRWRGLQRLTRYRRRTAGARIYMIFQPEAKPGQGGDGREKKKEKKTKAAVTERTQRKAKARPK